MKNENVFSVIPAGLPCGLPQATIPVRLLYRCDLRRRPALCRDRHHTTGNILFPAGNSGTGGRKLAAAGRETLFAVTFRRQPTQNISHLVDKHVGRERFLQKKRIVVLHPVMGEGGTDIPRHEQHLDFRVDYGQLFGQVDAVHHGHHDIGQQEVDFRVVRDYLKGLLTAGSSSTIRTVADSFLSMTDIAIGIKLFTNRAVNKIYRCWNACFLEILFF